VGLFLSSVSKNVYAPCLPGVGKGMVVDKCISVTLMHDLLAATDVKGSQVYMAWTMKSDESIRILERTSDSESFQWKLI
jgi:hypothetical protein